MGSVLRCVEGPAVGGDTIWVDGSGATSACPSTSRPRSPTCAPGTASSRPSGQTPDRAAPRAQREVPRRRAPGGRHPPRDRREGPVRQRFTTHFTNFHTAANVRYGFDYSPGGSELLNYLIRQASVPEYQVRWRWTKNSFAIWDNRCTQHYAVQDYFPTSARWSAAVIGEPTF